MFYCPVQQDNRDALRSKVTSVVVDLFWLWRTVKNVSGNFFCSSLGEQAEFCNGKRGKLTGIFVMKCLTTSNIIWASCKRKGVVYLVCMTPTGTKKNNYQSITSNSEESFFHLIHILEFPYILLTKC